MLTILPSIAGPRSSRTSPLDTSSPISCHHESFTTRQKATEDLEKLGPLAEPALKKVLEGQPGLETRQRVEKLIQRLESNAEPPPEQLRAIRAVRILEWLGTTESRAVLGGHAKGAPGARLTVDAQEAIERLNKRDK